MAKRITRFALLADLSRHYGQLKQAPSAQPPETDPVKWIEEEFPELRQLIPWVKQYVLDEGLKEPQWFDLRLHLRADPWEVAIIHGIIHEQRIYKTLGLLFAEGINALRADLYS